MRCLLELIINTEQFVQVLRDVQKVMCGDEKEEGEGNSK